MAEEHAYMVDGERVPSVSEIMRPLSVQVYGTEPNHRAETAMIRGTMVHKAIEDYDEYGIDLCPPDLDGYLAAYKLFRYNHPELEKLKSETQLYCDQPPVLFAGTIDEMGIVDGSPYVLDYKTNTAAKWNLWKVQLTAYAEMLRDEIAPEKPVRMFVFMPAADGTYRFKEVAEEPAIWMKLREIYKYTKQRNKTSNVGGHFTEQED